MRLLDLYCGAGGAAMGYCRAGITDIVGVDIKQQKHYPFTFILGDALEYLHDHGHEFDAIHASPPCQAFTTLKSMPNANHHDDLVGPTRELLKKIGKPYIIENVPGSPLGRGSVMLCGTMFGLGVKNARAELRRHRWFETSFYLLNNLECRHNNAPETIGVYGDSAGISHRRRAKLEAKPIQVIGVYGGEVYRCGACGFWHIGTKKPTHIRDIGRHKA